MTRPDEIAALADSELLDVTIKRLNDHIETADSTRGWERESAKQMGLAVRHIQELRSALRLSATSPSADVARIVEEHLDSHTFEKNDDGSIVIDRAGMILTMSEDKRLIQSAAHGGGTKSDGEGKAGPSPALASEGQQRIREHGVMPVGDIAASMDSIGAGPSDPAQEPEAVAWVIHGDDNARSDGSLDAMAWQEGEFTRPLYAKPQARPVSLDREVLPDELSYILEGIILRRLREDKIAGYVFETAKEQTDAILTLLEGKDAENARLTTANSELDEKWRYWQSRADNNESRISDLERQLAEETERCARVAEATTVSSRGHPQIDAPTPTDMRSAIAAAIRGGAK